MYEEKKTQKRKQQQQQQQLASFTGARPGAGGGGDGEGGRGEGGGGAGGGASEAARSAEIQGDFSGHVFSAFSEGGDLQHDHDALYALGTHVSHLDTRVGTHMEHLETRVEELHAALAKQTSLLERALGAR